MLYGITDIQKQRMCIEFAAFKEIEEVILFGSRAKGNHKYGSDIDLAIKGKNFNLKSMLKLSHRLEELNIPFKIDLIIYNNIKDSDVIDHIKRVGISFYKNT